MILDMLLLAAPAADSPAVTLPDWVIVGCAVVGAIALVFLMLISARTLAATKMVTKEIRNTALETRRWSEIAQRQTELSNAPLLKVVAVEDAPPDRDEQRKMRIKVKNVGFGSAVNVKCILTDQHDKEFPLARTELVGNEIACMESPLLYATVKVIRLEYLSQGGSYAHTTQYVMKSGGQSYALHRVR